MWLSLRFTDSTLNLHEVVVPGERKQDVIPSQQQKDYGGVGGINTVNIRSMGTNHAGVFYYGIQLSNAQNGQVDMGM